MKTDWIVTPARAPISGDAAVPGDKSIGHRAVLLAALAEGACDVTGLSGGEDNLRTIHALRALGVGIDERGPGALLVHGAGAHALRAPDAAIDCGNSGTSMRLLAGLAAGLPFATTLDGDEYLRRRPMRRVADPLERMGATVTGAPGRKPGELLPPLTIRGGALHAIDYALPVASAQVKSAILLAALQARGTTTVREPAPTRDHTERMLAYLGAAVAHPAPGAVAVSPGPLSPRPLDVPGDPSSAAFLCAAALVTRGAVRVRDVCVNPTRTGFLDALRAMGAAVELVSPRERCGEPLADLVVGAPDPLRAIELAGDLVVRAIDELPILAVIAARAAGTTTIRDAAELRVKESDRVAATVALLRAFGIAAEEREDGLVVPGAPDRPLAPATIESAGDHRIAMSAAVAALCAQAPSRIRSVDNVATSFPGFARTLGALAGDELVAEIGSARD